METLLSFDNSFATLSGSTTARPLVQDYLTFRPEGYQFTTAYKRKRWDGYKTIYNTASGRFPAGLTQDVAQMLRREGFEVGIADLREKPIASDAWFPGPELAVKLMPHQEEAVKRVEQMTRGVVHHPVGAGKSVVIVEVARRFGLPTLVLVQRKALLTQLYQQFVELLPGFKESIGYIGDGAWESRYFTVATIQSITSRLRKIETMQETLEWLKQWEVVEIDECHHLPAESYAALLRSLPNAYYRVGLSATPHRSGKREQELLVTGLTGPVISAYDSTEGIEMGRLVPADLFLVDPGTYPVPRRDLDYQKEVQYGIIENERRNRLVVKLAEQFGEQGPTMVLTERLAHGRTIRQQLLDDGHEEVK